jgi:hypothetical protein
VHLSAQDSSQTSEAKHLYRPASERVHDSTLAAIEIEKDSVTQDSIDARLKFIEDSIHIRLQFIQDSILARELFVRDSIQRRQRMRDSVLFLHAQFPRLLEASLKTFSDDIIVSTGKIDIIGDSTLTDFTSINLPFTIDQPYTPWKSTINLSNNPIKFTVDTIKKKITSLQSSKYTCSFVYGRNANVLRIEGKSSIANTRNGKLFKVPIDSVFFNSQGRVTKVKRYIHFHQATANYRKGAPLFLYLEQVKQFEYANNNLAKYQNIKFCKRERTSDPKKVCNIFTCSVAQQGNKYILSRQSDPANAYADGTFTYEFEQEDLLKSISFKNVKNTENWTTYIEVNEEGNVSRYIYKNKGAVHKTLLVNYNIPGSKYKVETITCIFEDDGVSYYQVNNATGKNRSRDKLTMEWGPWR